MTDWAEETEARLAPEMGWGEALFERAARRTGLELGEAGLLAPHGARDLAALLSRRHDAGAMAALAAIDPASLKIRQRIAAGVEARLDAAFQDEAALRRWAGFMALPPNLALSLRLAWESADRLWRWAGDTATDENHYSKRAILAGILISTLAVRLSSGRDAALAELAARIDNVMAFEKWKAGVKPSRTAAAVAKTLGRWRYG